MAEEIKKEVKNLPYSVVSGKNGDAYIKCKDGDEEKEYAPEFIASIVLGKLKADAEAYPAVFAASVAFLCRI